MNEMRDPASGANANSPQQPFQVAGSTPSAPTENTTAAPVDIGAPAEAKPQTGQYDDDPYLDQNASYAWTSAEFVAHQKDSNWYLLLGLSFIVATILIWLLTRDKFATFTVVICLALLVVYSRRQPKEQQYALDESGLTIGQRRYLYADFRSFSLGTEDNLSRVELTPMKRFAMYAALYFSPSDEERIVAILSDHLPMEELRNDLTSNLMRRLHL